MRNVGLGLRVALVGLGLVSLSGLTDGLGHFFTFSCDPGVFGRFSVIPWKPLELASAASLDQDSLECGQALRVVKWSFSKYGGPSHPDYRSTEFGAQALRKFLEKSDPHRLFLTRSEVDNFRRGAGRAWSEFVNHENCRFFEKFTSDPMTEAETKFHERLGRIPVEAFFPKKLTSDTSRLGDLKLKSFDGFANGEAELTTRLTSWVAQIADATSRQLLSAYQGNRRKLMEDVLEQSLFSQQSRTVSLLTKSVLAALDPYSTYFTPGEFEEFYEDLAGGTSGIGVKVRKVPTGFLVEKLLDGSPAQRSHHIHSGDIITAVDGASVADVPFDAARRILKGPEGSRVAIELNHVPGRARSELQLKRETFSFEDSRISLHLIPTKGQKPIAVIDVPSFYGRGGMNPLEDERSSSEDLAVILAKLQGKKAPAALVLDLRGNPGGFLEEAVSMASLFIGDKPVVEVVERSQKRVLRDLRRFRPLYNGPLIVLLDEGTASASEVLAGALKDYHRAILVGSSRSYGKGSVQRLFHIDQELSPELLGSKPGVGVVKLTTSIYYSPSGHTPANGGIRTDITLPEPLLAEKGDEREIAHPYSTPVPEQLPIPELSPRFSPRAELMKKSLPQLEALSHRRTHGLQLQEGDDDELQETVSIANDFARVMQEHAPQIANLKVSSPAAARR